MGLVKKSDGQILFAANLNDNLDFTLTNNLKFALDGATSTNQQNFEIDLMSSDNSESLKFMEYDSGNDRFNCLDHTKLYYVIITATALTTSAFELNGCSVTKFADGKWMVYRYDGADYQTNRASVMDTLFKNGSTSPLITDATSITAIQSPDSDDVGKRGHWSYITTTTTGNAQYTGTFANTSTNTNCSFWSDVDCDRTPAGYPSTNFARFELPEGTDINSVDPGAGEPAAQQNIEIGTDTSGDTTNNPADCELHCANAGGTNAFVKAIILCVGDITWVQNTDTGTNTVTNYDFNSDGSIPDFTATTDSELICSVVFNTNSTLGSTMSTIIASANGSLTGSNTITFEISFDGESNYEAISQNDVVIIANSGTDLWVRAIITRAANTQTDYITGYALYRS